MKHLFASVILVQILLSYPACAELTQDDLRNKLHQLADSDPIFRNDKAMNAGSITAHVWAPIGDSKFLYYKIVANWNRERLQTLVYAADGLPYSILEDDTMLTFEKGGTGVLLVESPGQAMLSLCARRKEFSLLISHDSKRRERLIEVDIRSILLFLDSLPDSKLNRDDDRINISGNGGMVSVVLNKTDGQEFVSKIIIRSKSGACVMLEEMRSEPKFTFVLQKLILEAEKSRTPLRRLRSKDDTPYLLTPREPFIRSSSESKIAQGLLFAISPGK